MHHAFENIYSNKQSISRFKHIIIIFREREKRVYDIIF